MKKVGRKRLFTALAAFLCSVSTLPAQISPAQKKNVDAIFAEFDKPDSPGCALGVIANGKFVYKRGYGQASLDLGVPIAPDTVFDIGSTSKQFTATSILLLEQQGKLKLDDDIRKYLPEIPDYGKTITIRHMLHHTSGLRDYLTLMALAGIDFHNVTSPDDALAIIARQKELNFAPGDEHLYSNSGYFLLSIIVERVSGKSLRAFAQENIFGPLAMRVTHYHDNHAEVTPRRAQAYEPKEGGGFSIDISNFEQLGDGAVFTSVEDMLKWDTNFYDPKVGGRKLIDGLLTRGKLNSGSELDYATGLVVGRFRGLPTVSHGGSWGGYRAELIRFPEQRFSVACLCNVGNANPSRKARQVAEVLLADKMEPAPQRPVTASTQGKAAASTPAADLQSFVGTYQNPQEGGLRRITVRDGKLRVDSFSPNSTELIPAGDASFWVADAPFPVQVTFEKAGQNVIALVVSRQSDPPETERFERRAPFAPSEEQLAEYGGRFFSAELDVRYTLQQRDGKLWMRIANNQPQELQPAVRDLFVGPFGIRLEFSRNADGRVTGFAVQAGRVRNIRFVERPED